MARMAGRGPHRPSRPSRPPPAARRAPRPLLAARREGTWGTRLRVSQRKGAWRRGAAGTTRVRGRRVAFVVGASHGGEVWASMVPHDSTSL